MASKTAERCKLWREKRKDDAKYWEQERIRKRNARRLRSAEKKEHDRELSRKRQRKFRRRKKVVSKVNTTQLQVQEATGYSLNIEIIDNTGSTSISSDDVSSQSSFHVTDTVSKLFLDHESKDSDSGESSDNMILEKDAMNDEDCYMVLQNLNGDRLAVVNTPTPKNDQSRTDEEMNEIKQREDTRHAYFQALQMALSHIDDFDSMKNHCNSYAQHIDNTYPIGALPILDGENYIIDWIASSLYPCDDAPDNHVPIKTGGDGNCLPRIGSLFVFCNEKQHVEFRVRIFMELCRFEDTYLDNSFLNRGSETPSDDIAMALALYSDVYVPHGKDKCRFAFRQYVKSVLQTNSFSGMWSIFGLASVIGVPIFSIYPSYGGHNVRQHLHRMVMPRVFRQDNSRLIHIMWTNTKGNQQSPSAWTPNHFVAVLPTQGTIQLSRETIPALATSALQSETGSNMQKEFLPTPPTSTPTKFVEMVESPTSVFLQHVGMDDPSVPSAIDKASDMYSVLNKTRDDVSLQQDVPKALVDQTGEGKPRHEHKCPSHPGEDLVYLCIECKEISLCYKCHLEDHIGHNLADLRTRLVEKENVYLRQLASTRERMVEIINQREMDHEKQTRRLQREINEMNELYQKQLNAWTGIQREKVNDRDQKTKCELKFLQSQLEHFDKMSENTFGELKTLPLPQRLSAMSVKPRQLPLTELFPHTNLVFAAGLVDLTDQLGGLTEIHDGIESARNDVPITRHTTNGSGLRVPKRNGIRAQTETLVKNNGQSTNTGNTSGISCNEDIIRIISSQKSQTPIHLFMKPTMETDQQSMNESLSDATFLKGGTHVNTVPNQDRLSLKEQQTLLVHISDEKVGHHVINCDESEVQNHTAECQVIASLANGMPQNFTNPLVVKSQVYGLSNSTNDRDQAKYGILHHTLNQQEVTDAILNIIKLPFQISPKAVMQVSSVGDILSVCDPLFCHVFRIIKKGNLLHKLNLPRRDVADMCASPSDDALWYICKDRTVRRLTLSTDFEVMFQAKCQPIKIASTSNGHVLILEKDSCGDFLLTLYTITGDIVRSAMLWCVSPPKTIKCSRAYDIGIFDEYGHTIHIYNSFLHLKKAHDVSHYGEDDISDITDFCFDRCGNIVICREQQIDIINTISGRYIRTVYCSPSASIMKSCDVDDDDVLWLLDYFKDELLAIRL